MARLSARNTHIIVLAVHTLAHFCTEYATLEAFTVLLQAGRLLAVAALGVAHSTIWGIAYALGVGVSLCSLYNSNIKDTGNELAMISYCRWFEILACMWLAEEFASHYKRQRRATLHPAAAAPAGSAHAMDG